MENSRVFIAVPSKRRGEIFRKNTWEWLQHVNCDWGVFLEGEDYISPEYAFIPKEKRFFLVDSNRGLGYSKTMIRQHADAKEYEFVFKVDDDIRGWTNFRKSLKGEEAAKQFEKNLEACLATFDISRDVAVISFPYSFQMFEQFDWKPVKRVQTAYITRREFFHVNSNISVCEDFATGLYAITKNKWVLQYGMSGMQLGVEVGGGEGGLQSFDRSERMLKEIDLLREIYPPLKFRKVDKSWKYEPDLRSVKIGLYLK